MRNIRLDICYDGTRYRGWQRLPGKDDTIQGKLETALSRILEEPIEISGSGRTDAGVHARGQVANFHTESSVACGEILANLRILQDSGKPYIIRTPLIPGITDQEENLSAIQSLIGNATWEQLPYNALAGAKYKMLDMEYTL